MSKTDDEGADDLHIPSKEELAQMSPQDIAGLVSEQYAADVYFYSGPINNIGFGYVTKAISTNKKRDKALLILTTNGGQANSAYQIARLFQKVYSVFTLFTPSYCKSAGTLIALGAHGLIMDEFSELGPLDVQLPKENEIGGRRSGLLSKSSFESLQDVAFDLYEHFMLKITMSSQGLVSFKLASELSAQVASSLMAPVYSQINPDIVGSDYRDMNVAMQYGLRLAGFSENADAATVKHLVNHYPSHDFIIDNEEASDLFKNVNQPSELLYLLLSSLGDSAYIEEDAPVVLCLRQEPEETDDDLGDDDEQRHTAEGGEKVAAMDSDGEDDRAVDRKPPDEKPTGDSSDGIAKESPFPKSRTTRARARP